MQNITTIIDATAVVAVINANSAVVAASVRGVARMLKERLEFGLFGKHHPGPPIHPGKRGYQSASRLNLQQRWLRCWQMDDRSGRCSRSMSRSLGLSLALSGVQ